eukprot:324653-Chlamydomonas_euryale.AAC.4
MARCAARHCRSCPQPEDERGWEGAFHRSSTVLSWTEKLQGPSRRLHVPGAATCGPGATP